MYRFLMVPIQVDALHLAEPLTVTDGMSDFSRLPFFDGRGDVNADNAYVSENLVSVPFHNGQLPLSAGIHLHWSLPDTLTRSHTVDKDKSQVTFPAAPNVWLVTRRAEDDGDARHWIVESDYLYPEEETADGRVFAGGAASGSISYPIRAGRNGHGLPYRYMGRQLPLHEWFEKRRASDEYLPTVTGHPLTALGYGEPAFAAFYPNCHSVFGFHDRNPPVNIGGIRYYVLGWYRDDADDFCQTPAFQTALKDPDDDGIVRLLQDAFNWDLSHYHDGDPNRGQIETPDSLLCYGRIAFEASDRQSDKAEGAADLRIAVGNTATEALSAYLADMISAGEPAQRRRMEDRLESLHLLADLEHRQLDVGPKFYEARHSKGFRASPGGTLWTVRLSGTDRNAESSAVQATLPEAFAHVLNQLNLAQQRYDTAHATMVSLRQRLFADWYRYMLSAYPPDDQRDDYPDIDEVKLFIQQHDLDPLIELEASTGTSTFERRDVSALGDSVLTSSLGDQVNYWWNQICDLLLEQQEDEGYAIDDWGALARQWNAISKSGKDRFASLGADLGHLLEASQEAVLQSLAELGRRNDLVDNLPFPGRAPNPAQKLLDLRTMQPWSAEESQYYNRLLLQAYLPTLGNPYALHQIAGPRFWQPNEPVVLLSGAAVEATDRHSHTKAMRCRVIEIDKAKQELPDSVSQFTGAVDELFRDFDEAVNALNDEIEQLTAQGAAARTGRSEAQQRLDDLLNDGLPGNRFNRGIPWHPFMLEWEAIIEPIGGESSNLHASNRGFDATFITAHYQLAENAADLSPKRHDDPAGNRGIYQGRSILTPHAAPALLREIDAYFEKQVMGAYYAVHKDAVPDPGFFEENRSAVIDWCRSEPSGVVDNFMLFILDVEQKVRTGFHVLAQSLTGFDAALMGHKQTMQLSIADPLGFAEYRAFADKVRAAVGPHTSVAPQPMSDFNPIRSGRMRISRLRLIDTFGRYRDIDGERLQNIVSANTLHNGAGDDQDGVHLAPRLMQPARLHLHWKSNGHGPGYGQKEARDDVQMNAHPATSPICGWLLPNNLDGSLMVYSQAGQALGYLDRRNQWRIAPGGASRTWSTEDIVNPHLRRVVRWIEAKGSAFLDPFISTLDSALENIDPENWAHHQGMALLMGRALAVARTELRLELKGLPATNQSWDVFWQDLHNGRETDADTDRVQDVEFPIRLGEHRQLNDGLAGYWVEGRHGDLAGEFFTPQSDLDDIHPAIKTGSAEPEGQLLVSANGPACSLTLLVDPRGKVHATSGILPVRVVDIPPDQYAGALESIGITFLSAPILGKRRQGGAAGPPDLPLPEEPGYQWQWVEQDSNAQWHVTTPSGEVGREARLDGPLDVREGWLSLNPRRNETDSNS